MHFVNAKGILSAKNGMNIYRGCTHGCIYCDSRSECYGVTHEFEDIEVKQNAACLLESKLRSKRKKCMIGTGAMCDPYLHCEKDLQLTRKCLEVIDRYEFGVSVLTKSDMVLRDLDLLKSINNKSKAVVQLTVTTFDDDLCRIIEPNVCVTSERFKVLGQMKNAGIPTVVWLTPVLPFINDTEDNIVKIVDECVRVGVKGIMIFGVGVTLRDGDREYFYEALDKHFPGMKEKYINTYGNAYDIPSPNSKMLYEIIKTKCKNAGIMYKPEEIFRYLNDFPENKGYEQLSLF